MDQVSAPLAEMIGVSKSYGGVEAVRNVDVTVGPGEVQALLGENGAGKSTLMKILSGEVGGHRAKSGSVRRSSSRGAGRPACRRGDDLPGTGSRSRAFRAGEHLSRPRGPASSWVRIVSNGFVPVKRQLVTIAKALSFDPAS